MQPVRTYPAVFLAFLLLMLSACSSQPAKSRNDSVRPSPQEHARETVVVTAREMLGAPYRYGGTTPRGFDCSGLVWYSHQRAGIAVPRRSRQQMSSVRQVGMGSLRGGDLLFFSIDGRASYHVGIYVGDGRFIHAPSSGKKVSSARLDNPYWRSRFLRAGNYY